ncbi:RidA family protein [Rhodococcus opacus]
MMEGRPFRRRPSREHFQAPPRSFLVLGGGPAIHGRRVLVSGHGPLAEDGTPAGPFGSVPVAATHSARLTALAVLAGVRRAVGDLDRIGAWLTVRGFVNAEPGYEQTTAVLNGFSEVVLDVFGPDIGGHARTAIGVAALPLDLPVVVAAELELA